MIQPLPLPPPPSMPDSGQAPGSVGQNIPRPDPSDRTTLGLYREIEHLRELLEGQIRATNERIDSEKELTGALFKASTENVATAFTAAKEAVSKQEADTSKRIEGLQAMLRTVESGLTLRFEDLKSRMDRGEGKGAGMAGAGAIVATVIGVLGTLVAIVLAFFAFGKP